MIIRPGFGDLQIACRVAVVHGAGVVAYQTGGIDVGIVAAQGDPRCLGGAGADGAPVVPAHQAADVDGGHIISGQAHPVAGDGAVREIALVPAHQRTHIDGLHAVGYEVALFLVGYGVGRPAGTFANEHQIADTAEFIDPAEEAHLIGGTLNVQVLDHMVPAIVGDEIGIRLGADGLLAQEGLAEVSLPIVPSVAQIQVLPQGAAGSEQSFVLGIESAQGIQVPGAAQVQHAGLALQGGAEAAGEIGIEIVGAGLVILPDGELLIEGAGLGVAVIVQHIRREPVEIVFLAALGSHRDPVLVGQGSGAVSQLDHGLPVVALFGQIGQGPRIRTRSA